MGVLREVVLRVLLYLSKLLTLQQGGDDKQKVSLSPMSMDSPLHRHSHPFIWVKERQP